MKYHKLRAGEETGTYVMESPVTEADILQMAQQLAMSRLFKGRALTEPTQVFSHLQTLLQYHEYEVFALLLLDTKHRVIGFAVLAVTQFFIEWVQQPAVAVLYLRGKGELIVFLGQTLDLAVDVGQHPRQLRIRMLQHGIDSPYPVTTALGVVGRDNRFEDVAPVGGALFILRVELGQ